MSDASRDGAAAGPSGSPTWFGPPDRPLAGWIHQPPAGQARRAVVLCPSQGVEALCIHFTYRLLAERLAAEGVLVVRFDYDGCGDSAGTGDDPDRLGAWLRSVGAAADLASSLTDAPLGLVGIRLGALMAGLAARRAGGVESLVLWDPSVTGRSFLREQEALRVLAIGTKGPDGVVDGPGLRYSATTAAELSTSSLLSGDDRIADRVLALTRTGQEDRRLAARLGSSRVEWAEAVGQDALLDWGRQEPPLATIDRITGWLSGDELPAHAVKPAPPAAAATMPVPGGPPVTERFVRFGQADLVGIVCEPFGAGPRGPSMVLVDEGLTPHVGQSRMWVDLSRRWAAAGLRVLRFDLSGSGESGVRRGQAPHVPRAPEMFADVAEAVRLASPDDPSDVVLIGLCSGAYQAAENALVLAPRGVCLINPYMDFVPPEGHDPTWRHVRRSRQHTRRPVYVAARPVVRWIASRRSPLTAARWDYAFAAGRWPLAIAHRHPSIPAAVWRVVNKLLIANVPARTLRSLDRLGVRILLVAGREDFLRVSLGAAAHLAALRRSPRYEEITLDHLDHAGLIIEQRQELLDRLTAYVEATYLPS